MPSYHRLPVVVCLTVVLFNACAPPEEIPEEVALYAEQHRPQLHFSPPSGWMNDPNGLVYHAGEYHLFYQHYPDSTVWGPMHWGHAVSSDLVHWNHLPIALYPDSMGYIFSGSAVVDYRNTSGFGDNGIAPLVAIFTHHDMVGQHAGRQDIEVQSIAYSLNKGRSWTKYSGNPVVPNPGIRNFRDPKVFWHGPSSHWIMPIASHDHLDFYRSPDLKQWEKSGEFGQGHGAHGGVWECPDIFPLVAEDGTEKWILIQNMDRGAVNGGSGTQYFVGHFDGLTFHNDHPPGKTLWFDYGADNYAGVTWFGVPEDRRIFIGWMSQWFDYAQVVPTTIWRSAMTVPRDLFLRETRDGYRLLQWPAEELTQLRKDTTAFPGQGVSGTFTVNDGSVCHELSLVFDLTNTDATQFGFMLKNDLGEQVIAGYNTADTSVYIDRTMAGKSGFSERFARIDRAPYLPPAATLRMHAIVDVASVELFVDDGRLVLTEIFFPNVDFDQTIVFATGGEAALKSAQVYRLRSIWDQDTQ
jgi:fructan beta-fructosidase